jgi:hypothetical protein
MKVVFSAFIMCAIILACSKKNGLQKDYKIFKSEIELRSETGKSDSMALNYYVSLFKEETFLKLSQNNVYTILSQDGDYNTGKWQLTDNTQELQFMPVAIAKCNFTLKKEIEADTDLEYLILKNTDKKLKVNLLLVEDDYYETKKSNLLSDEANWWRKRPLKKESNEQIKKRILAQLDYMIQYFEMIDSKNLTSFMVKHLKSPYLFYSNGIGLDENNLLKNSMFYDYADTMTALQYYNKALNSISEYPADTESFTKGYTNALKKISKTISLM